MRKAMIEFIKNLFNKKKKIIEDFIIVTVKPFNIDEFNEWFKYEFDGYDGRKGAEGIFLRTDKLSSIWIQSYLKHIGQDYSHEEGIKYYDIVRKDWINKLNSKDR